MTNEELIAEARQEVSIHDKLGDGFSEGSEERAFYYGHRDRYKRLADALEARQPSEEGEYILRLIETIKQTGGSVEVSGVKIMPCDEFGRTAAVPDAATEVIAAIADELTPGRRNRDLILAARELKAERDAALAAVERVRVAKHEVDSVHQIHGADCLCGYSSARSRSRTEHITEAMLAALDGAPEPGGRWEYGREYRDEAGAPHVREASDVSSPDGHRADGSPYWNYRAMRRRPAGPWLPVEGEKL